MTARLKLEQQQPRARLSGAVVTIFVVVGLLATASVLNASRGTSFLLQDLGGKLVSTTMTANNASKLIDLIAPMVFPLDPETGHIALPPTVRSVMIDVGARQSDYMRHLEDIEDNTTALILVDPLPDSIIPLQGRVSGYAMRNSDDGRFWLDPVKQSQVFALRAALSETEGRTRFNVGTGPACGSLLKSGEDAFWCFKSSRSLDAIVLRLEDLLDLVPPRIESIHLKVDAEGADLMVLKGAGRNMGRLDTIVIECIDDTRTVDEDGNPVEIEEGHEGECLASHASAFMKGENFVEEKHPDPHAFNMYFVNNHSPTVGGANAYLPPLLTTGRLSFQPFYNNLKKKQKKANNKK